MLDEIAVRSAFSSPRLNHAELFWRIAAKDRRRPIKETA
jgi:hypothetical protein